MFVTLQDVAIILGLRIHGLPITSTCDIDWSLLCYELLCVTPLAYEIKGSTISTRWLCHQFSHPPIDSNDICHIRAVCISFHISIHRFNAIYKTRKVPTLELFTLWMMCPWQALLLGKSSLLLLKLNSGCIGGSLFISCSILLAHLHS